MKTRLPELARFALLLGLARWTGTQESYAQTTITCTASKGEGNTVVISWNTVAAGVYGVESKTSLAVPWEAGVVLTATNGSLSLIVPVEAGSRFFRVAKIGSTLPGTVWIPAGIFTMGSPPNERNRESDEGPQTVVTLTKDFWLGKFDVTQREYLAVMGNNPSYFTGDLDQPVEQVSWNDAVAYCHKLADQERAAGRLPAGYEYGLPTEAQWEYACRAGTTMRYSFGDALECNDWCSPCSIANQYMWWCGNQWDGTTPDAPRRVGQKLPNAWGLYDMHGNVWEWCRDLYSNSYPGGSMIDPKGPNSGSGRVIRGGCWANLRQHCRSADRFNCRPDYWSYNIGFRVALVAVP